MISFQNPILNNSMQQLDFATSMRINTIYSNLKSHLENKDIPKIETLISAYYKQCLVEGNNMLNLLINNKHFTNKLGDMTQEQINMYVFLCSKALLGVLLNNKTLLKKYSTDDHIKICQIHLACGENPFIASMIEIAGKHKAKVSYIKKIVAIILDPKSQGEWLNPLEDLLLSDAFYNIKSDFERLIILNHIINAHNDEEKGLYRHLATSESFTSNNDAYYLIDLVKKVISLNDLQLTSALIAEIQAKPELTHIYTPDNLVTIMRYIHDIPHAQSYFFNKFVQAHFSGDEIMKIFYLADDDTYADIETLISHLETIVEKKLPVIPTLEEIYKHNLDEEDTKEASLRYKISKDGEWIDA